MFDIAKKRDVISARGMVKRRVRQDNLLTGSEFAGLALRFATPRADITYMPFLCNFQYGPFFPAFARYARNVVGVVMGNYHINKTCLLLKSVL